MDLEKLDVVKASNEGFKCIIKNPKTSLPTDIAITIKGAYSGSFLNECEKADTDEKTAAVLARFTMGWEGIEENSAPLSFSVDTAERVYKQYPIIRGQVLNAAMDIRNFIRD